MTSDCLSGTIGSARFAFFFYHLDFNKPLLTPFGPVTIPGPTPIPTHLQEFEYEVP